MKTDEFEVSWLDNSMSGCDEDDEPVYVIEVSFLDARTQKRYLSRRCIGEVTRQLVSCSDKTSCEPGESSIKREMRRVADELENFILIGVC